MHAPKFWQSDNVLARLLDPIGQIVGAVTERKIKRAKPLRVGVPVICIGNLSVGGTGKTPVAAAVAARLRELGKNPAILMRGYGGKLKGPTKVDPSAHSYEDVGDEALLHTSTSPVWVSRNRALGALEAIKDGADALVMDDGHQHTTLAKDVSFVVVDGALGFGNGRITPAGPLREHIKPGLSRADAIVLMGEDTIGLSDRLSTYAPVLRAHIAPGPEWQKLKGRKVVAFAGIGTPEKFLQALTVVGARVVAFHPFDDHYGYADADIQTILDEAFSLDALPVTTPKDAVRLTPDQRQQVDVLSVYIQWQDRTALDPILGRVINQQA